ncbi:hypothetical protein H1C71_032194 [Ictidomys tridecemlineatus]|nr:hypothetical protein H1C71_032194 [Ictidomys tridecemlineatus]
MDEVFSSRPDLTDQPLKGADAEYFTDGSSFIKDEECFAGHAVVTLDSTVEAEPLPQGTSGQKVKHCFDSSTSVDSRSLCGYLQTQNIRVHRALSRLINSGGKKKKT